MFDGVGGLLQGDAEVGALTAGEVGQDEVGGVLAARRAADAYAQARVVLGGDGLADGAQAVVTAFAAAALEAQLVGGQVELVVDDEQAAGGVDPVVGDEPGHGAAGEVHEH